LRHADIAGGKEANPLAYLGLFGVRQLDDE
jgi:hypothetical protein